MVHVVDLDTAVSVTRHIQYMDMALTRHIHTYIHRPICRLGIGTDHNYLSELLENDTLCSYNVATVSCIVFKYR